MKKRKRTGERLRDRRYRKGHFRRWTLDSGQLATLLWTMDILYVRYNRTGWRRRKWVKKLRECRSWRPCIVKSSFGIKNSILSLSCSVYSSADGRAGLKGRNVIEKCDKNSLKMVSSKTTFPFLSLILFEEKDCGLEGWETAGG